MLKKSKNKFSDVPVILRDYLNYMTVIKGRSENTVKEYYYDLKMFYRYISSIINDTDLYSIDKIDVSEFDDRLKFMTDASVPTCRSLDKPLVSVHDKDPEYFQLQQLL